MPGIGSRAARRATAGRRRNPQTPQQTPTALPERLIGSAGPFAVLPGADGRTKVSPIGVNGQDQWVPPAGFEPATHGLGNRCSIP